MIVSSGPDEPCPPFLIKNGEYEFVHPLTLEEQAVNEMRFLAHADPFHKACRGVVARVTRADNTVPSELAESQRKHGFGRFGGQTSPVVVRVEDKSRLTLTVLPAEPLEANLANHPAGLAPHHCERQPLALGVERGFCALFFQSPPDLRAIAGLPGQVPGDIRAGLVG